VAFEPVLVVRFRVCDHYQISLSVKYKEKR
jgi:hypothetical protein